MMPAAKPPATMAGTMIDDPGEETFFAVVMRGNVAHRRANKTIMRPSLKAFRRSLSLRDESGVKGSGRG